MYVVLIYTYTTYNNETHKYCIAYFYAFICPYTVLKLACMLYTQPNCRAAVPLCGHWRSPVYMCGLVYTIHHMHYICEHTTHTRYTYFMCLIRVREAQQNGKRPSVTLPMGCIYKTLFTAQHTAIDTAAPAHIHKLNYIHTETADGYTDRCGSVCRCRHMH